MTDARYPLWEYAILTVDWGWRVNKHGVGEYKYKAVVSVDGEVISAEEYAEKYWSQPLAKMGRLGWELVGNIPQNTLIDGWLPGFPGPTAVPVSTNFLFKRPLIEES